MSGSGEILDDDLRESDEVDYAEEDTFTGETADLLESPVSYIREIVLGLLVGGILSAVTFATEFGLAAISAWTGAIESGGGAVESSIVTIQTTALDALLIPFGLLDGLAASAGPFAPVVVALTWALTAALTAVVAWTLYRIVRFI